LRCYSHAASTPPAADMINPQVTRQYKILDWNLMAKTGYVVAMVVVGFLLVSVGLIFLLVG